MKFQGSNKVQFPSGIQAFKDYSSTQSKVRNLQQKAQHLKDSYGQNDFGGYQTFQEYEKLKQQKNQNDKLIFQEASLPMFQRGKGLQNLKAKPFVAYDHASPQPEQRSYLHLEKYKWPENTYLSFDRMYRGIPKKKVFRNLITNQEVDYSMSGQNTEVGPSSNYQLNTTRERNSRSSLFRESAEQILTPKPANSIQSPLNPSYLNAYSDIFNNKRYPRNLPKSEVNNIITGEHKNFSLKNSAQQMVIIDKRESPLGFKDSAYQNNQSNPKPSPFYKVFQGL